MHFSSKCSMSTSLAQMYLSQTFQGQHEIVCLTKEFYYYLWSEGPWTCIDSFSWQYLKNSFPCFTKTFNALLLGRRKANYSQCIFPFVKVPWKNVLLLKLMMMIDTCTRLVTFVPVSLRLDNWVCKFETVKLQISLVMFSFSSPGQNLLHWESVLYHNITQSSQSSFRYTLTSVSTDLIAAHHGDIAAYREITI